MRRSHRRHYRRLGDADMTDSGPLKITPGQRFSLEADQPASKRDSDFGPSEPPPQRLPAGKKDKILPFLTPQVGNTLAGAGVLAILGGVGYYVWKGGDLGSLFGQLFSFGSDSGSGTTDRRGIAYSVNTSLTIPSGYTPSAPRPPRDEY